MQSRIFDRAPFRNEILCKEKRRSVKFLESFQIILIFMVGDRYITLVMVQADLHSLRCIKYDQVPRSHKHLCDLLIG